MIQNYLMHVQSAMASSRRWPGKPVKIAGGAQALSMMRLCAIRQTF